MGYRHFHTVIPLALQNCHLHSVTLTLPFILVLDRHKSVLQPVFMAIHVNPALYSTLLVQCSLSALLFLLYTCCLIFLKSSLKCTMTLTCRPEKMHTSALSHSNMQHCQSSCSSYELRMSSVTFLKWNILGAKTYSTSQQGVLIDDPDNESFIKNECARFLETNDTTDLISIFSMVNGESSIKWYKYLIFCLQKKKGTRT